MVENYHIRPKPTTPKPENIKPPAQKPKPIAEQPGVGDLQKELAHLLKSGYDLGRASAKLEKIIM